MTGDRGAEDHRIGHALGARGRPLDGTDSAIEHVAASDATVLILGELGVGHDDVARAVHRLSPRRDRPYEVVNCTLPADRLDSELFGDSRHTTAGLRSATAGKLVLAHTGTVFLDDVGELPPAIQRKLLLVLQDRQVTQAGADEPINVDVRLLAATHRDLRTQVEAGLFRQDLYYRLNVLRLYVRPLRQRRQEIPDLARYFLEKYARRHGRAVRELSAAAHERLLAHQWPGNLSELENLMERVVVLNTEDVVVEELEAPPATSSVDAPAARDHTPSFTTTPRARPTPGGRPSASRRRPRNAA